MKKDFEEIKNNLTKEQYEELKKCSYLRITMSEMLNNPDKAKKIMLWDEMDAERLTDFYSVRDKLFDKYGRDTKIWKDNIDYFIDYLKLRSWYII